MLGYKSSRMLAAITMNKRQLLALCLCSGLIIFQGATTTGVLPVYALRLGADSAATGLFQAAGFGGVMVGNIIGGWLSDRVSRRKALMLISLALWIPAALLLTQAASVAALTLMAGLMWIPGGIANAMVVTIMGLSAPGPERGKAFGLMGMSMAIGSLVTGLASGPIAERWGFPALFVVMAALVAAKLVIATFITDPPARPKTTTAAAPVQLGRLFYVLVLANLFSRLGMFSSDLVRPLAMTALDYDAAAVSSAIAVSAAVTIPLPLVLGWLSDRLGRRRFILISYGVGALGLLLLIPASALWHFWLSASLVATIFTTNGVTQAFAADIVPPGTMGRGISLLITSNFLAGILGLGGAGYIMRLLGKDVTLLLGAGLLLCAFALASRVRQPPAESYSTTGEIEHVV